MITEQQASLPKGIAEVQESFRRFYDLFDQATQYIGLDAESSAEFASPSST